MTAEEIQAYMEQICPSWIDSKDAISRSFVAKDFKCAMDFINKVAEVAESQGHHPDIRIFGYRNVEIKISTFSLKTLSKNDFILAAKLDHLPIEYSPKFLKEHPDIRAGRILN